MSNPGAKNPPTEAPSLEAELKTAVRKVMNNHLVVEADIAKVQEILDRKATPMRAPFLERVRRAKLGT
ncbi:MAG: hypothetical protein JF627_07340 [Alphaproteobacteria bacterium]|nr:hypothetical protein [Alphaproteobacteria bacterium]